MYQVVLLFAMICLFDLIFAELKSCDVKTDEVEVCYRYKGGYKWPFFNESKIDLDTMFFLKAITEINENENSISIQAELWSFWVDLELGISNNSTE